jgi:hypothetical protein
MCDGGDGEWELAELRLGVVRVGLETLCRAMRHWRDCWYDGFKVSTVRKGEHNTIGNCVKQVGAFGSTRMVSRIDVTRDEAGQLLNVFSCHTCHFVN